MECISKLPPCPLVPIFGNCDPYKKVYGREIKRCRRYPRSPCFMALTPPFSCGGFTIPILYPRNCLPMECDEVPPYPPCSQQCSPPCTPPCSPPEMLVAFRRRLVRRNLNGQLLAEYDCFPAYFKLSRSY